MKFVEPKVLKFPDELQDERNKDMSPGALNFGEEPTPTPAPVKKTSPAPAGPKAVLFNETPSPSVAPSPAKPTQTGSNEPKRLELKDDPTPANSTSKVETRAPIGKPLFDNQMSPMVRKAIDLMKTKYADLYKAEGPSLDNKLNQLLPFKLEIVNSWGDTAVEKQAELTSRVASLVQNYSQLNVTENLDEIVSEARGNNQNSISKFFRGTPDIKAKRFAVLALQQQVNGIVPEIDDCFQEESKLQQKIVVAVATISVAASISETPNDNTLATAVQNRRLLLGQAAKQAEILVPQLKEMRSQIATISSKIDQILNVTLPGLELAHAAKLK